MPIYSGLSKAGSTKLKKSSLNSDAAADRVHSFKRPRWVKNKTRPAVLVKS